MRVHCKRDFDTKVTEFAMYLRQETPSEVNNEPDEVLSKDEEELLRKFGKFLEMDRRDKHGKFGRHGHHGHFEHWYSRFHGHGKHGHHQHGHFGKHGHDHGKHTGQQDLKQLFEELSEMQKKLAASLNGGPAESRGKCDSGIRHWGRHGHWKLGHCNRRRWNSAPAAPIQVATNHEGANESEATQNDSRCKCDSGRRHWGRHGHWKIEQCKRGKWNSVPATPNQVNTDPDPQGTNESEATQNLAAMVETIDLENSPNTSEQ